jgi:UDP-N-acetylglucosamine 2-epimerase (non-hydrolysing)
MSVVGARPNFMKVAPVIAELERRPGQFRTSLVHTGQHYDDTMSRIFLEQLGVGAPDHALEVGSGSHAFQTARVMERMELVLEADPPDILLVPGDINSTLAAALVAAKRGISIGHIEAGLRSFDRSMPEELNRMVTDQLSSALFIHSPEAGDNLLREGADARRIHAVGNTMIDTLVAMRPAIHAVGAAARLGLESGKYLVVTLHRPALVDGPLLSEAMAALDEVARDLSVVFRSIRERVRCSSDRACRSARPIYGSWTRSGISSSSVSWRQQPEC